MFRLFKMVINFVISITNNSWKYLKMSYSQEGEDLILVNLFENKEKGFYIDVGAHHPFRFSNTYFFYKKGWRGINIDAMPGSMKLFDKYRRRDINVECGVSDKKEILKYYEFNEPALNGFSKQLSESRENSNGYKIVGCQNICLFPLNTILEKYLPKNQKIDFLTIDIEGFEKDVFRKFDFKKYSPEIVIVEILDGLKDIEKNVIYKLLVSRKYYLFSSTGRTCFFKRKYD